MSRTARVVLGAVGNWWTRLVTTLEENVVTVVSGFRHYVVKAFGLLPLYVAYFECWLKTFRSNLSVPSSNVILGMLDC
jgi:hypothetical protein